HANWRDSDSRKFAARPLPARCSIARANPVGARPRRSPFVAFDALDHVRSLNDFAPRAVNASTTAPDQSPLLLLFNFPLDLQQPCDFVLLDHGRKRGFEALFIAVLMLATPRLRR